MTADQRLDRDVPRILADLAAAPYPDYIDDVLATTAQRRQRPAWTFRERWLPVDVVTRPVPTPTLAWRQLGVLALVGLLIVAALAVFVGSQPRLPEPFGVAVNGLIAFVDQGDIYVSDSIDAKPHVLVGGSAIDSEVQVSRDGRAVTFLREFDDGLHLMVAGIDGSDVRQLSMEPLRNVTRRSWSPDGQAVAVAHDVAGIPKVSIIPVDGSGGHTLATPGVAASFPDWRPPNGKELAFRGQVLDRVDIYLVNADGSDLRPLGVTTQGVASGNGDLLGLTWSPDGSRIAYHSHDVIPAQRVANGDRWQVHVVDVTTLADTVASRSSDPAIEDTEPTWSPDGRRLLVQRFSDGIAAWMAIIPAAGGDSGLDLDMRSEEYPASGWRGEFSPDGSLIIGYYDHTDEAMAFDSVTGAASPIQWSISDVPTWQRLAP